MIGLLAFGLAAVGVFFMVVALDQDDPLQTIAAALLSLGCFALCALVLAVGAKRDIVAAIERRPVSAESAR